MRLAQLWSYATEILCDDYEWSCKSLMSLTLFYIALHAWKKS